MTEPGWYDDPDDVHLARWHDGDAFTEHTTLKAEHATAPPPPSAPLRPAWPDAAPAQPSPLPPEGTFADRELAPVAPEAAPPEQGDGRSIDPRFYGGLSEGAITLGNLLLQIGQAYDEAADRDSNPERRAWNKGVAEAYFTNVAHIPSLERDTGGLAQLGEFNQIMSSNLLAVSEHADEPHRTRFMGKSSGHDKVVAILSAAEPLKAIVALRDSVRRTGEGKGVRGRRMFGRRG